MSRFAAVKIGVVILITVVGYVILTRPSPPLIVSIQFIGYTNDASGQLHASFSISNGCSFAVRRWGSFTAEEQQRPGRFVTHDLGPNATLAPSQSEVVTFPVPPLMSMGAWRAVFDFSREGARTQFGDWTSSTRVVPEVLSGTPVDAKPSQWIER